MNIPTSLRPTRPTGRAARVGIALAAVTLVAGTALPAGFAADGDDGSDPSVDVVNTETVQAYLGADGSVDSQRVYEQLVLTGTGHASLSNPVSTDGLRNLDGFGGFGVSEDAQTVDTDVDGVERLRSVSDFDGDLPLSVSVEYRLDGELIDPADVVGRSGLLEAAYTVRNTTAREQEVSFPDGRGGTVTETAEVPIPMVGSLTTVLPPAFTEVASDQANMAGDGKGGTKMTYTLTLFPPLGSDELTVGWTARVRDGVVPSASISALPVNPLESASFKSAGESYSAGADTGQELAAGATEIDTNLLKLRDGAGDLLAGLIQLRDGADELSAGLRDEAGPGSRKLADGAAQLSDGLGDLEDGTGRLNAGADDLDAGAGRLDAGATQLGDGSQRLAGGTGDALTGSRKLEGGLQRISGGLGKLSGRLPDAQGGIVKLKGGVDQILTGFGNPSNPRSLIGGLDLLERELGGALAADKAPALAGGLRELRGDAGSPADPLDGFGLAKAQNAVSLIKQGLDAAVASEDLENGLRAVKANFCATHPAIAQCNGLVDEILTGVSESKGRLATAAGGLGQVSGADGLGRALAALDGLLVPGADGLVAGLTKARVGAGDLRTGAQDLRAGVLLLDGGLDDLAEGVTAAVTGVMQLSAGADEAYAGSGDLSGGLAQLDGGAQELASGAGRLTEGTSDLTDGTGQLAAGASELDAGAGTAADGSEQLAGGASDLADGLGAATDGSGRLADGLGEAAGAAPRLEDGAERLSEEGMSQLIDAGEGTAQDYGKLYAVISAGAQRADAEKMAYGAPEGATGLTAYSFELASATGEGGRNGLRAGGAALLLGLALGSAALRRRMRLG